jgi:signal transduction histidine kinase
LRYLLSEQAVHSLGAKLLLFSLLLVVVPGVVFALIALVSARHGLEGAVGRQLAEVAHDTATTVEQVLIQQHKNIRTWARQDLMREIVIGDLDKRITRFLVSLKQGDTSYLDLLCADASGRIVAATNPALVGALHTDSAWFRAALRREDFLSGPTRTSTTSHAVLEIAAPVYDPDGTGKIIGALLGLYDWERQGAAITERIQRELLPLRLKADVLVLDGEGRVIAEPQPALAGQDLRTVGWVSAQRRAPTTVGLGFVREPLADALVGYAQLDQPRPDWSALVMQPLDEAMAPVSRMQKRFALALAGVLLAGFGVAVLLADRMIRPLRELTRATQEIARVGETRRPVPVRSRDEIGQLAEAFNAMAAELKGAQDDLVAAAKFAFVGEVAAGVAHEIRTPLGILRSSAQILGRSLPNGNAGSHELVDMIVGEVDRLDRVVAGLLELARPHEPLIEPTALAPLVGRALDFVEGQAREKGLTIHRAFSADRSAARCDPEQIYQVALNLVVNALQILPRGGQLTARTFPPKDGCVSFEVSDNGPGIPAELRERVFTPFFTMREGGTGLGLALVQRVVQTHQGTVTLHSTMGEGTTFRVELPVTEGGP